MNILELSKKRFSARKYTAEPVSKEDLDYIMECVRMAPSAVNKQPWKFVIVRSEEAKAKLQLAYDREWQGRRIKIIRIKTATFPIVRH